VSELRAEDGDAGGTVAVASTRAREDCDVEQTVVVACVVDSWPDQREVERRKSHKFDGLFVCWAAFPRSALYLCAIIFCDHESLSELIMNGG
jgi:hypothetical protein